MVYISSIITTKTENEAKGPSKLTNGTQKDPIEKQSSKEDLTVNDTNVIETTSK